MYDQKLQTEWEPPKPVPPTIIVSMSLGWLFLGGLVLTRARFRFANRGPWWRKRGYGETFNRKGAHRILFQGGVHPAGLDLFCAIPHIPLATDLRSLHLVRDLPIGRPA